MALTFYLSSQNGSDTHGGSSESVIASGTGTADVTQGDATVDLSDAGPDLSGVNQGATHDTIRLAGRTDGRYGTDIFEITAVDDQNDTVEVSPAPTGASQSDLDWCIGGPWDKPQKAMNMVAGGDHVWWKADGDYTDDSDSDGVCAKIKRAGTATAPIVFEGYKTTPGDADAYRQAHPGLRASDGSLDQYRATMNGSPSALVSGIGVVSGLGGIALRYVFKNVRVRNCSAQGFYVGPQNERGVRWENCRADTNLLGISAYELLAYFCSWDSNTLFGASGESHQKLFHCDVMNNGDDGMSTGSGGLALIANRIFGNGGMAVNASASSGTHHIMNNTLDGDGKPDDVPGLCLNVACQGVVANNIIHDFAIGAKCEGGNPGTRLLVRNNLFTDNTVHRDNFPAGPGDLTGDDPGFIDEVNGDYRLRFDSAARGAGCPEYTDIGAEQRREIPSHRPTDIGVQV